MQTYICKVSKIDEELNIIVLYPARNKYLRWKLPTPAHLIQKNLKINNSFDIFQLDCASEIRKAHNFIPVTTEVEVRKATSAIWNSAEEGVKTEYRKLNLEIKKFNDQPEVKMEPVIFYFQPIGAYIAYMFPVFIACNSDGRDDQHDIFQNDRKAEKNLEIEVLIFETLVKFCYIDDKKMKKNLENPAESPTFDVNHLIPKQTQVLKELDKKVRVTWSQESILTEIKYYYEILSKIESEKREFI
ncbi:17685_t:CDS:2 [Funneliformis geosporum]|uniref:17685_t:CDS:1 n=1 Tax=Funneliformis geosporum TaxID=1117311 RepID=A0A9W4T7K5_9GLOM|nr:17685_t:CDS:2 [Funneliformis geosporum]